MQTPEKTTCTILNYHYVRDVQKSDFPNLKACDVKRFDVQLEYISRNYTVISLSHYLDFIEAKIPFLPANPCVLTFDDGLNDHFNFVLPRLVSRGFTGIFFISTKPLVDDVVLDVHKHHFITAHIGPKEYLTRFKNCLEQLGISYSSETLPLSAPIGHPLDSKETQELKQMLYTVNQEHRIKIVDAIFQEIFGNEKDFSQDLYLNKNSIQQMSELGMTIGSHSHSHELLPMFGKDYQYEDIRLSKTILEDVVKTDINLFCYPKGMYDTNTIEVLKKLNFRGAVTVKSGINHFVESPFTLERMDTTDFKSSDYNF